MIKNTKSSYGSIAKIIHWVVAFAVISMIVLGFTMDTFQEPLKSTLYGYHEEFGLTIMAIMLFRVYWRIINPTPALPDSTPRWQGTLAKLAHYLLYIALFVMIASGWAKSTASGYIPNFYGLFELPMPFVYQNQAIVALAKVVHLATAWVIISMVSLHILAALHHHFICKDKVLKQMLPSKSAPQYHTGGAVKSST